MPEIEEHGEFSEVNSINTSSIGQKENCQAADLIASILSTKIENMTMGSDHQ